MKRSDILMEEIKFMEAILPEEKRKFKSLLSPKLKEMWEKIEIFEQKYSIIYGYLSKEILPPSMYIGDIITLTNELLDDFTFIVRMRLDEETVKEFEESMQKYKKKLDELEKNIASASIGKDVKLRQVSMYVRMASSFVLTYIKVVFSNFKDSLSLISDVWAPMEKKFAEIAVKRIGIMPEEEEKKRRGEDEL